MNDIIYSELSKIPLKLLELSYDFLLGFYNGMFQIEAKTTQDLTYDYLKGFYEGVRVRRPKN